MSAFQTAVQILSAILTPLVAIGGLYIARQNMLTAKHKIRIDLFDKRMRVVNDLKDLIDLMYRKDPLKDGDPYIKFIDVIKEANWLFPPKVNTWLETSIGETIKAIVLKLDDIDVVDDMEAAKRSELRNDLRELKKKLVEADHRFRDQFAPYLQLYEATTIG